MIVDSKDKLFINKNSRHSTVYGANWQDLNWYSDSYQFAFETLINNCKKEIRYSQLLFLPTVYIFRHYIEIRMKEILKTLNSEKYIKSLNHNIYDIWQDIRVDYENNFDYNYDEKEEFDNYENLLSELSSIDELSFSFRYPTNKCLQQSLDFAVVDFDNFIDVANKMINFIASLNDLIQNSR